MVLKCRPAGNEAWSPCSGLSSLPCLRASHYGNRVLPAKGHSAAAAQPEPVALVGALRHLAPLFSTQLPHEVKGLNRACISHLLGLSVHCTCAVAKQSIVHCMWLCQQAMPSLFSFRHSLAIVNTWPLQDAKALLQICHCAG
jgi:hypothetical protein